MAFVLALFQSWILGRLRRLGDVAVEAPPGAGKTLMVRALVALDLGLPNGFSHVVVAAPMEQIERGFLHDVDVTIAWPAGVAAHPTLRVPARLFRAARRDGCGTRSSIKRYLAAAERAHALVCTHAAVSLLREEDLPADLHGRLLVVDEAHHAPAKGLSRISDLWRARGGRLLYFTATPYRHDGLPVVLPGMAHIRRSLAEHMEQGFAPSTLSSEIVALGRRAQRVTPAQLTGDAAPPKAYTAATARAVLSKWVQDGKPKAVVRVPPGRGQLVRKIIAAFQRAGARVLDATGVERARKLRFLEALDAERGLSIGASQTDVIVGIQRVLEGTNWPVCAAVYCIGIPRSLQVVVQLIGRSLRKKPVGYPMAYCDRARAVFFVPCAGGGALAELSTDHSRHVLLVSAFMADHEVGQGWVVTAAVQRGVRLALGGRPEDELDTAMDSTNVAGDPVVRAEVQLALVAAHQDVIEAGQPATAATLTEQVRTTRPDLPTEVVEQVTVEFLATMSGVGKQVKSRLEEEVAAQLRIDPQVQKAMQAAFATVLAEFRDATLEDSPALQHLGQQIHTLTGGTMRQFASRLAAAQPLPLTIATLLAWADAEHAASGAWPSAVSGAVRGAPPHENWAALDAALRRGSRGLPAGSSIAQLLEEHRGAPNHLEPRRLTLETIETAARTYHETHGRWPSRASGAIPGTPFTWCAVNIALDRGLHGLPGGTTLARVLEGLGARNIQRLRPLNDALVARWARRFRKAHGRWPTPKDGQIDGAANGETWTRIGASIVQGRRGIKSRTSLAAFLAEVCGAPPPGSVRRPLKLAEIVEHARSYHHKYGKWPTAASVDPEVEKIGDSWHRYDRAMRTGNRGLPQTAFLELYAKHGKRRVRRSASKRRRRGRSA